jgi:endonuclease/exonuclease/phosphatase family metal-dependent hydrolase
MKKLLKALALSLLVVLLAFFCFLLYFTLVDYQPEAKEIVSVSQQPDTIYVGMPVHVITWNIGYAGLDRDMDFFYDGGLKVRPTKEQAGKNMKGIGDYLVDNGQKSDFFLIQEIDEDAKRSYYINQIASFNDVLHEFRPFYAMNYNVQFVPLPVTAPMGKVKSGLITYSRHLPVIAERNTFPFNFSFPLRLFMLDRCFLVLRFPTSNGRELVLINTHNSAFDNKGEIRMAELDYFRKYLTEEYEKGNYVIAGGDFNQSPPAIKPEFSGQPFDFVDFHVIPDTLLPADWKYAFDNFVPSNRRTNIPYKKGETKVTLIDFFVLSPNVSVDSVRCDDLEFEFSDHNPVRGFFRLME